jgi:antitoxin Phd
MKAFTFSQARQRLCTVLDLAQADGEVRVTRRDGRVFFITPVQNKKPPLPIKGVALGLSKNEIVGFIQESRRG